jgi:hypothetical protein
MHSLVLFILTLNLAMICDANKLVSDVDVNNVYRRLEAYILWLFHYVICKKSPNSFVDKLLFVTPSVSHHVIYD